MTGGGAERYPDIGHRLKASTDDKTDLYSLMRITPYSPTRIQTPIVGSVSATTTDGGSNTAFLKTQGDTMIGPIAFAQGALVAIDATGHIDISKNSGDYSTYVLVTGAGSPDDLNWIDGAAFNGQFLVLQGTASQTINIVHATTPGTNGNIVTADATDVTLVGGANNDVPIAMFIFDVTVAGLGAWRYIGGSGSGGGSGTQTPWLQDIDADGFDVFDISNIQFRESTGPLSAAQTGFYMQNNDLTANVASGNFYELRVADTPEYSFDSTKFTVGTNEIHFVNATQKIFGDANGVTLQSDTGVGKSLSLAMGGTPYLFLADNPTARVELINAEMRLNGNALFFDADDDTKIQAGLDDVLDFTIGGVAPAVQFSLSQASAVFTPIVIGGAGFDANSADVIDVDRLRFTSDSTVVVSPDDPSIFADTNDALVYNAKDFLDSGHFFKIGDVTRFALIEDAQESASMELISGVLNATSSIVFDKTNPTPSDGQVIGTMQWRGTRTGNASLVVYGGIDVQYQDVAVGTNTGVMKLYTFSNGVEDKFLEYNQGNLGTLEMFQPLEMNSNYISNLGGNTISDASDIGTVDAAADWLLILDGSATTNLKKVRVDNLPAGTTSPLTTKGDIWVYTTTDARLPIGATTGHVLTVDPAEASGMKWAAGGGGGANTALSNLASVAINTSLVSDTDLNDSLGSSSTRWLKLWVGDIEMVKTAGFPLFEMNRDDTTPTADDVLGRIMFQGQDDLPSSQDYAWIQGISKDVTSGVEEGGLEFHFVHDGDLTKTFMEIYPTSTTFKLAMQSSDDITLDFYQTGATGAGVDIAKLSFFGDTDAVGLQKELYASILVEIDTDTSGSESGRMVFMTKEGGQDTEWLEYDGSLDPSIIFRDDINMQNHQLWMDEVTGGNPGGQANTAKIYAIDNGGKTELRVVFGTGAAQTIAAEP